PSTFHRHSAIQLPSPLTSIPPNLILHPSAFPSNRFLRRPWDPDRERRAHVHRRFHCDRPAHVLDGLAAHGKAEPRAVGTLCREEGKEYLLQLVRRNAHAVVADDDDQRV